MLKIGIVGTGNIADAHITGYLEFPEECEIVALNDLSPEVAAAKKEKFGLTGAKVFESPEELFASGLDLVSITTPPKSHASLTVSALDAGINVLVEKPMAPSLEECDLMLAAQVRSGKILSVVAQNRFRDDMATLKEAIDSGLIGAVSSVRVDSLWWRGLSYYDLWWRGTWESEGGGCTLNHAIHHIDLLLWLLGKPEQVVSMITNAQHNNAEVEDLSVAIFRYGRALAQLTSSVVNHGEDQEIVIQGEKARISQPWKVNAERAQPNGFPAEDGNTALIQQLDALKDAHVPLENENHAGQIGDVLASIRQSRPPLISGIDGKNAVEIVTAIYKSGIEQGIVSLPLDESDPYYGVGGLAARAPHFFEKVQSVKELPGEIVVGSSVDK